MNNSKGLAYTSFAVLAASLIVLTVSLQVNQPESIRTADASRIGDASFFLQSTFSDMDRSLRIATRRALTGATNYIVETGEGLEDPQENLSEALVNGTLGGESLNDTEEASLSEWESRVSDIASRSGYELSVRVTDYSFEESGTSITSSFEVFGRLRDPTTLATFNETESATTEVSIDGVEDTMILLESKGRYINQYEICGFDKPAEKLYTGSQNSSSTFHGYAAKNPSDISSVEGKPDKVLVVDDVDSYQESEVEEFGGAVSEDESSNPGSYSTDYVFGTSSISEIGENMSLVIHQDQVWRSSFREMFNQGCYLSDENGPDFFERLEGMTQGGDDSGLATLIDVSRLPPELQKTGSAVGYVYFGEDDYGDLNEIDGVTGEYSWFRLDEEHVDSWNLTEIAE